MVILNGFDEKERVKKFLTAFSQGTLRFHCSWVPLLEAEAKRLAHGRFVLIPISDQTHGHGTHTWAAVWKQYLEELLEESQH